MSINTCNSCEEVLLDLGGIASMVNRKMHVTDLHERVDIFFYIDSSITARELCSQLQKTPDVEAVRKLSELHLKVTERWKKDREILSPERQIIR